MFDHLHNFCNGFAYFGGFPPFKRGFIEDFPKNPLTTFRQTHVNQGADARTQGGILKTPWTISKFAKGLRTFSNSSSSHPQPSHHLFGFSPCSTVSHAPCSALIAQGIFQSLIEDPMAEILIATSRAA